MENQRRERVIHSYDTKRRQVLCGIAEQSNSTKHAAGVTCVTCRDLLGRAPTTRPYVAAEAHRH